MRRRHGRDTVDADIFTTIKNRSSSAHFFNIRKTWTEAHGGLLGQCVQYTVDAVEAEGCTVDAED